MKPTAPPLIAVLRLVWASLTVRIVRHLVTSLSVALAVAFLISIAGEAVATRAVALADAQERRAAEQVQELRRAIVQPRNNTILLEQMARNEAATSTWVTAVLGTPAQQYDVTAAQQAVIMLEWLNALSPARAWLATRTNDRTDWVLHFDDPGRLDAFMEVLRGLPGLKPPLDETQRRAFAEHLPAIRAALQACARAELERIARLEAAGGLTARLALIEGDLTVMDDPLLPVSLILPYWNNADAPAFRVQLRLDRLRSAGQAVLANRAQQDPSLLDMSSVDDWVAFTRAVKNAVDQGDARMAVILTHDREAALDSEHLAATLRGDMAARQAIIGVCNASLDDPALSQAELWKESELPAEVARLMGQDSVQLAPRTRTRLNRLLLNVAFPGISPPAMAVPADIDTITRNDQAGQLVRVVLRTSLGADDATLILAEQMRHERREKLSAAFTARGGNPQKIDTRRMALAGLALLVCTVGVINALLMAIHERFREIATMKCLGARDSFIVRVILWEAAAIGAVGASMGAALGMAIVVTQASGRYGQVFWEEIPTGGLFLVIVGGIAIGMLLALTGALIPARIASRMPPVAALRVEI